MEWNVTNYSGGLQGKEKRAQVTEGTSSHGTKFYDGDPRAFRSSDSREMRVPIQYNWVVYERKGFKKLRESQSCT
jgi:hypothetical protein